MADQAARDRRASQATNVERGTDILETLELQSASSEHPTSGVRDVPDEMLEAPVDCRFATTLRRSKTPSSTRSSACSSRWAQRWSAARTG